MKTVLFPTDFSDNSIQAIKYGIELFGSIDECEFIIAHAYETPQAGATMLISIDNLLKDEITGRLKLLRDELCGKYYAVCDLKISLAAYKGNAVKMIKKLAQESSIDYVVMGTKGSSGIKEVLLGSTTHDVIRDIKLPVIVVPKNTVLKKPKKVVFATDLKQVNEAILQPLYKLAEASGASIDVLNILEGEVMVEEVESFQEDNLSAKFFGIYGHHYHQITGNDVEKSLLSYAQKNNADLLCVVNRERGFFEKLMHNSITKKLTFHSQTPLIILKEE